MSTDLHVIITCCAEYTSFLTDVLKSVRKHVLDKIVSITIISNINIPVPNDCNFIHDNDFWKILDPSFQYRTVYNQNWIKQQLFKLHCDKILQGNVLWLEGDNILTKDIKFIHEEKFRFYAFTDDLMSARNMLKEFFNIEQHVIDNKTVSFMTEHIITETTVLAEMRQSLVKKYNKSFLSIIEDIVINSSLNITLIEYDLYGHYFVKEHSNKIYDIVLDDSSFYRANINGITSNTGNQTKWITFYEQIRGINWPDCESEEDFVNLPINIQTECIEIFGYKPKQNRKDT